MNIKEVANGVLRELEARGYAENTLSQHSYLIFGQIVSWFDDRNEVKLNEISVEAYHNEISSRLESGKISRTYYNQLRCCMNRMLEYSETGKISLVTSPVAQEFRPSNQAIAEIESALAATSLNDDFKYKIRSTLRAFYCFVENQGLTEQGITRDAMVSFIHHKSKLSSGYMAYIVRSLRILSEYLVAIGKMGNSPDFRLIAPKRSPQKLIPPFYENEVTAILSEIDRSTAIGKRNYASILLAIGTGLRGCDIVKLKLTDIDWKSQTIRIIQSKTGKALSVSINGQICNAVADYILNDRPKTDCQNIFVRSRAPFVALSRGGSMGQIIDRICEKAGVEKKENRSFHSLRRTFGTWLSAEEVPVTTIAQMLGHAEMDSSKPYLSFNDAQIYSCAMGFEEIPVKGGVYSGLC